MLEDLAYIQSHGGIMATVLLLVVFGIAVRGIDLFVWYRSLKKVAQRASEDVGQHELNYHMEEVLRRARMSKNLRRRESDNEPAGQSQDTQA